MTSLKGIGFHIKNYKCFKDEPAGFDQVLPLNILVGRNNSGKSSLLDLVEWIVGDQKDSEGNPKPGIPEIHINRLLHEQELKQVFKQGTSGGSLPGDHWDYGKQWVGGSIAWVHRASPTESIVVNVTPPVRPEHKGFFQRLVSKFTSPFKDRLFQRLLSDRDMQPEAHDRPLVFSPNGEGATTVIRHFLTKASLPENLVESTLLNDLNRIFEPDSRFIDITVQQLEDERWEIFLAEETKGRIPLSRSGSGLKTVILVLVCLHLVPKLSGRDIGTYVYVLEELENNLHPALQRRLFAFLREMAVEKGCLLFISTHSASVLDQFSKDSKVQILHVRNDGKRAAVSQAITYFERSGILDDLDVRASDLLQANGIVWVEGPSDRLYFNRWIELWTDGELREGQHYQCVFYGGRLMAHLTAEEPDLAIPQLVKILNVNRNAILIMDSDRKKPRQRLNPTKQRLKREFEKFGSSVWVTDGIEVENYLSCDLLQRHYGKAPPPSWGLYRPIIDCLSRIKSGEGARFARQKVLYAERFCDHMEKKDLDAVPKLASKLDEAAKRIRRWNGAQKP